MEKTEFSSIMQKYLNTIDTYIDNECVQYLSEPQKNLFDSMRYSLLAGGKRLRPIFVYEFCRMCGGDWKTATPFAAAIEMIHTSSLIHDDLPCMDNDDYRRGRLTNHKVYGETMAVLAGDALLMEAFVALAQAKFSPSVMESASRLLAVNAGCTGMIGGQALDVESEERLCTEQEVLDIQIRKTGALIRAACQLGVLAGNGTDAQMSAAGRFADHLGLAFQIRDDMLDVIGNAQELGKQVGVDEGKNTFVRLYGLDTCNRLVKEHTDSAIAELKHFENTEFTSRLSEQLVGRMK